MKGIEIYTVMDFHDGLWNGKVFQVNRFILE